MQRRVEGWATIQSAISVKHESVEFRRAGYSRFDLFRDKMGSEKAVDVKLATDLIVLKDIYDVAIIVSGDQDYVPAVQVVKDCGKKVVSVVFKTRSGKLLPGGAWRLNEVTDSCFEADYAQLSNFLNVAS